MKRSIHLNHSPLPYLPTSLSLSLLVQQKVSNSKKKIATPYILKREHLIYLKGILNERRKKLNTYFRNFYLNNTICFCVCCRVFSLYFLFYFKIICVLFYVFLFYFLLILRELTTIIIIKKIKKVSN